MLDNSNAPLINEYMKAVDLAANYFAVAHPTSASPSQCWSFCFSRPPARTTRSRPELAITSRRLNGVFFRGIRHAGVPDSYGLGNER
jgi:hypothetical protein